MTARTGPAWLLGAALVALAGCRTLPEAQEEHAWPEIRLEATDRILVLAPHPDDEVLGCGGVIQRAVAMGLPLRIVFLTHGDNNQLSFLVYRKRPVIRPNAAKQAGLLRYDEAMAAAAVLGVPADDLTLLGYPDFGTLRIWEAHWSGSPPLRSMLTKVTAVPYDNAFRPGAAHKGEEILRDLTTILRDFRPTKVFVSHPADHNPDHRSLYLFSRVALWNLEGELQPAVYPYLIHFRRWPARKGWRPTEPLDPPQALRVLAAWRQFRLAPEELERNAEALRAHRTQYGYSAKYLRSFMRPNELFGELPVVAVPDSDTVHVRSEHAAGGEEEGPPEELTDQEEAAFVGLEERFIRMERDRLVLTVTFSRPLGETVGASFFVFGYRPDRPFEEMPKIHIQLREGTYQVYDQKEALSPDVVQVTRQPNRIVVTLSLETLGHPRRLLTSARTYLGEVPLDWMSWRTVELSGPT